MTQNLQSGRLQVLCDRFVSFVKVDRIKFRINDGFIIPILTKNVKQNESPRTIRKVSTLVKSGDDHTFEALPASSDLFKANKGDANAHGAASAGARFTSHSSYFQSNSLRESGRICNCVSKRRGRHACSVLECFQKVEIIIEAALHAGFSNAMPRA